MAAAVLRHAARRLVGVQRTQAAAIAEERRRLLPRLVHTDEHARARPETLSEAVDEIQEKKEELYDLIAITENDVHTDRENRSLLRDLSVHIKPRPDDVQWRWMHAAKRRHDVLKPAGIATSFITSVVCWFMLREMDDFKAREAARKENQQQMDHAAAAGEKEEVILLSHHAPVGADARARELDLLGEEINHLRAERQRLQGKLDDARSLASLASFGRGERQRLQGKLDLDLQAMLVANNALREQVKALGGKPQS